MQKTWHMSGVLWAGVKTVGRLVTPVSTPKSPAITTGLATTWQGVSFHGTISEAQETKYFLVVIHVIMNTRPFLQSAAMYLSNYEYKSWNNLFWKCLILCEYHNFAEARRKRILWWHDFTAKFSNKSMLTAGNLKCLSSCHYFFTLSMLHIIFQLQLLLIYVF